MPAATARMRRTWRAALPARLRRVVKDMVLAVMLVTVAVTVALAEPTTAIERGGYLAAAAGCVTCHTDREHDGADYAGGLRLETPFGVFVAPNITPDRATGIGDWSLTQFSAALRQGIRPAGGYYYPAFPYASYAGLSDADVADLKAFFDSLPPANRPNQPNELAWYVPGRYAMGIWQWLFAPWDYSPVEADADPELQRGALLVRHLGHCGECHTPRTLFGALETRRELAGTPKEALGGGAPAINGPGLKDWSLEELEFFLDFGMAPNGDFAGSGMGAVISDNTSQLTAEDRRAIARFLLSRE